MKVETVFLSKAEYNLLKSLNNASKTLAEISTFQNIDDLTCKKNVYELVEKGLINKTYKKTSYVSKIRGTPNPENYNKFGIPFLSFPSSVDIFITNRCNLQCVHCFSADDNKEKNDMLYSDLTRLFDQLEKKAVFEVRLNGGEPFVHSNIVEILKDLGKRRFRKVLITNGAMLSEDLVKLMKTSLVIPTVSLDDSIAEEHDRFRGVVGSHKATIEGLKLLKKNNVQYGINTCVNKRNMRRFYKIIDLAIKLGAYRISFLDLKSAGRMKKNPVWVPSVNEYQRMLPALTLAQKMYEEIDVSYDVFLHCHPLQESIHEAGKGIISCSAGKARLSIDSRGLVYPCNMVLYDPYWVMGNAFVDDLEDIWFNEKWSFFRGDVKMEELVVCNECTRKSSCKDIYCRLYPYVTSGDLYAPHPNCPQEI
jgi:radical SAM protein with 4Fe4S-binding SPASM domain